MGRKRRSKHRPVKQAKHPSSPARSSSTTIQAAVIVKNGESSIARALRSIDGAVDEILIDDTGSTDRTVEIINDLKEKMETPISLRQIDPVVWATEEKDGFYHIDFAATRNQLLERATAEWIFVIDADEALEPGPSLYRAVEEAARAAADQGGDASLVSVVSITLEVKGFQGGVESEALSFRLHRRGPVTWRFPIHNELQGIKGHLAFPDVRIKTSYQGHVRDRFERSYKGLLKWSESEDRALYYLAMLCQGHPEHQEKSIEVCERILAEESLPEEQLGAIAKTYIDAILNWEGADAAERALYKLLPRFGSFSDMHKRRVSFAMARWAVAIENEPSVSTPVESAKVAQHINHTSQVLQLSTPFVYSMLKGDRPCLKSQQS